MKSIHFNLTISSFYFSCGRNRRVWSLITINPIDIPFNESVFRSLLFPHKKNETILRSVLASQLKESKTLGKPKIECVRVQVKDQTKNLYFWPKTCTFCATQKKGERHKMHERMWTTIFISALTLGMYSTVSRWLHLIVAPSMISFRFLLSLNHILCSLHWSGNQAYTWRSCKCANTDKFIFFFISSNKIQKFRFYILFLLAAGTCNAA